MKKIILLLAIFAVAICNNSFAQTTATVSKTEMIITDMKEASPDSSYIYYVSFGIVDSTVSMYRIGLEVAYTSFDKFKTVCKGLMAKGNTLVKNGERNSTFYYENKEDWELNHTNRYFVWSPSYYITENGVNKPLVIPLPIETFDQLTDGLLIIAEIRMALAVQTLNLNKKQEKIKKNSGT